jgi:hypothetical protein
MTQSNNNSESLVISNNTESDTVSKVNSVLGETEVAKKEGRMDKLKELKDRILGLLKRNPVEDKVQPLVITKKLYLSKAGDLTVAEGAEETTSISDEESILVRDFGATGIEVWEIQGFYGLSSEKAAKVSSELGLNISDWKVSEETGFSLNVNAFTRNSVLDALVQNGMSIFDPRNEKTLVPGHASWKFGKKSLRLVVCDRNSKLESLTESIFYRSGQDIANKVKGNPFTARLLVVQASGTVQLDGDFYIKKGISGTKFDGLVRSFLKLFGDFSKVGVIKGSVCESNSFVRTGIIESGFNVEMFDKVDGIVSVDNIKWLDKETLNSLIGQVIEVTLYPAKYTTEEQKDGYSVPLLMGAFAWMTREKTSLLWSLVHKALSKGKKKLEGISPEKLISSLTEEDVAGINTELVKFSLGIGDMTQDVTETLTKSFTKLIEKKSAYVKGRVRDQWGSLKAPIEPVLSPALYEFFMRITTPNEKGERWVSFWRNPITDAYSFKSFRLIDPTPYWEAIGGYDIDHDFCAYFVTELAKDSGLDGDDMVALVADQWFKTIVGERYAHLGAPIAEPTKDTTPLTRERAYYFGAKSQQLTGLVFNTMLKINLLKLDYLASDSKMFKKQIDDCISAIDKTKDDLQAVVQAIKKVVIVPEVEDLNQRVKDCNIAEIFDIDSILMTVLNSKLSSSQKLSAVCSALNLRKKDLDGIQAIGKAIKPGEDFNLRKIMNEKLEKFNNIIGSSEFEHSRVQLWERGNNLSMAKKHAWGYKVRATSLAGFVSVQDFEEFINAPVSDKRYWGRLRLVLAEYFRLSANVALEARKVDKTDGKKSKQDFIIDQLDAKWLAAFYEIEKIGFPTYTSNFKKYNELAGVVFKGKKYFWYKSTTKKLVDGYEILEAFLVSLNGNEKIVVPKNEIYLMEVVRIWEGSLVSGWKTPYVMFSNGKTISLSSGNTTKVVLPAPSKVVDRPNRAINPIAVDFFNSKDSTNPTVN